MYSTVTNMHLVRFPFFSVAIFDTHPILPKTTRSQIVDITFPISYLWNFFQIQMLTQNVRLLSNTYNGTHSLSSTFFADWLLQIGDELVVHPDTDDPQDTSWIQIQDSLLIPPGSASLKNLIEFVYGTNILNNPITADLLVRAIVCPKNKMADIINRIILKTIGTCGKIYNSTDGMEPNGKHTSDL